MDVGQTEEGALINPDPTNPGSNSAKVKQGVIPFLFVGETALVVKFLSHLTEPDPALHPGT